MAKTDDKETKPEVNGDDVVGTGNDARLKLLEQINNQNDETLAKNGDLLDVMEDGTTSNFAAEETLSDEEIAAREIARAEEEANLRADAETKSVTVETKHKIKVNGKELELSTQELIERAQKVEAADQYLKDAAQKLREAEVSKQTQTQPSGEDVAARELEEKRQLVRAIQMGTEEEAMAAIEKLQSRALPSVSADDVARTVDERLTFNDAVQRFQREYKDLCDDPVLLNIVTSRDKELLAQGDKRGYWERYEEIGNSVREWKASIAKPAEPAAPEKPDKQARKASAPAVPTGAAVKAPAATEDEDKEESVGEIISNMAKVRGGPQWLRG